MDLIFMPKAIFYLIKGACGAEIVVLRGLGGFFGPLCIRLAIGGKGLIPL